MPKSPSNLTSTFFNTVRLLPKDLSFEHEGAKLASCPGPHLTSLRPWLLAQPGTAAGEGAGFSAQSVYAIVPAGYAVWIGL